MATKAVKVNKSAKKPAPAKPITKPAVRKKASPAQDKLNALGAEVIVAKIKSGQTYREIADEVGVGLATLFDWIEASPERSHACATARESSAQAFDDMAIAELRGAADAFELSKAKELAVHYRWRSKVSNPRRYGDKIDLTATQTITGTLDVTLSADEAYTRMVEQK